ARGGLTGKRYPRGDEITHDDANYKGTDGKDQWSKCAPVGSFTPNDYGLYDMAGNAREWCADWYDENYYSNSPPKNPPGPGTGSKRLLRGGDWNNGSSRLRVAYRDINLPKIRGLNYGFRCVSGSNITPGPSAGGDFTLLPLDNPSPSEGPEGGGTVITMNGSGFAAGATVSVGGNEASEVNVVSATQMTAVTPAGTAGAVDVVVANGDGQTVTLSNAFTYTTPATPSGSTAGMVLIPGGSFQMGDAFSEGDNDERPVHTVTLDDFYMDKAEVTVGQFKAFLADSDYSWVGSWNNVA
ncbi:MAG: SUMF1/EgtB/PvdO family nonheme iron enzyme, partial [Candidatus Poribacteria bacterium]|nr:SUMF1/EgtB/PvdO family nonheme iron enzyme [Candidatus Poribacteria bacterium]